MFTFRVKQGAGKEGVASAAKKSSVLHVFGDNENDEREDEEQQHTDETVTAKPCPPPSSWFKEGQQAVTPSDELLLLEHEDVLEEKEHVDGVVRKRPTGGDNNEEHRCGAREEELLQSKKKPRHNVKTAGLVSLGRFTNESTSSDVHDEPQPPAPRYISRLIRQSTHREMEHEIIKARLLKKDQKDDEDVFVTKAYRKRLEERQKFEEEMAKKDIKDALNDPKKKRDLTSFHHYMLSSGLASRSQAADPSKTQS